MLNNEKSQIQLENDELKQECTAVEQLRQELAEVQAKEQADRKVLDEEKSSLIQLQKEVLEKSHVLEIEKRAMDLQEFANFKQEALLMLKERLMGHAYQRRMENQEDETYSQTHRPPPEVQEPEATEEKEPQRNIINNNNTNPGGLKESAEEDNDSVREKPRALSGINSKSETESISHDPVNASANFPSRSPGLSLLKKEQELEDQLRAIEEEKGRLRDEKARLAEERSEVETMRAMLSREAEGGKPFSFIKPEEKARAEEQKVPMAPVEETKATPNVEVVNNPAVDNSDEFKPDPHFLDMINDNIVKVNDKCHDSEPEDKAEAEPEVEHEAEKTAEQVHEERPPEPVLDPDEEIKKEEEVLLSPQSYHSPEQPSAKKEAAEPQTEAKGGLVFRAQSDESSEESIVYKDGNVFDEPKRAVYGIKPSPT